MQIDIRSNVAQVSKMISANQKQIPYATALTLTRLAQELKEVQIAEMKRVFDNPVPYTLNALAYKKATKKDLTSKVFFKEFAGKGTPAYKYLMPNIIGGERRQKRHEKALEISGKMTSGGYTMPARNIPLNAYGNLNGSYYRKILSQVGAAGEQNLKKTSQRGKKTKISFFPIKNTGIFERIGDEIRPVLLYIGSPKYKPVYDFYGIGERFYKRNFANFFMKAFKIAVKTARK